MAPRGAQTAVWFTNGHRTPPPCSENRYAERFPDSSPGVRRARNRSRVRTTLSGLGLDHHTRRVAPRDA